jgi:ketosteroid isomerase-like protein
MVKKLSLFATAEAAEEALYEALETGDLEGLMSLWGEEDEPICIHPNGLKLVGLGPIRASMEEIMANGGIDIRVSDCVIHQTATMSVHHLTERLTMDTEQGKQVVQLAATNVYLKSAQGWQLYLHQVTPIAAEQVGTTTPAQVLH